MEEMCFSQCQGQPPRTALCHLPQGARGVPEVPIYQEGLSQAHMAVSELLAGPWDTVL